MYHKGIRSGSMRDHVKFYEPDNDTSTDIWNDPSGRTLVFEARANCMTRSGEQNEAYGTSVTSEVITALMWLDERAKNDQVVVWKDKEYEVIHVKPDSGNKSMIVTIRLISK